MDVKPVLYLGCPPSERDETERMLASAHMSVVWADNVGYALSELERREMPVLLDLSRGAAALQVARELRTRRPSLLMFAIVDNRRPDLTTEAVLTGVADVFARPPGGRRLATAIERELQGLPRPSPQSREHHETTLYCHSLSMREVVNVIARAATMRAGVMIRGEEGTGRHVVARAIHGAPSDRDPFVSIDCAGHEGQDLEVELFGERARSSHAEKPGHGLEQVSRASRLYAARGGTLYLRNIADASTRVQGRLGRVLRDREAVLVETGSPVALDVRPIAGVDPGIELAIQDGRVRDDLFKRLSVIRIDMPPLRNRREDIPALANYFVREICAAHGVPPKALSRAALLLIAALPWGGNAIELRALLETLIVGLAGGRGIGLEDVLAHVRLDGGAVVSVSTGSLRQARARFERDYIAHVLEQHRGRISEAAKALGIQRTNLYRKIRALRVHRDRRRH